MHCDFACLLYSMLESKLTDAELHAIVGEAVEYEKEFICEALSVALIGMNKDMMGQYIEFCADRLLVALDAPKLYHAKNPFVRRSPCGPSVHSMFLTATPTPTRTGWNSSACRGRPISSKSESRNTKKRM